MVKIYFFCSLLALCNTILAQGPYAPPAGQNGSTAMHQDSSVFVTWATNCTVTRGPQDISSNNSPLVNVGNNTSAIGKAGVNGIVSLGDGGSAILTFNAPIKNGTGADFAIFENSFSDDFLELAFVEVSSDGVNYFRFNAISLTDTATQTAAFGSTEATNIYNLAGKYRGQYGTPFDLDELGDTTGLNIDSVTHIKIIDAVGSIDPQYATYDSQNRAINDPFPTPFGSSGFDLDGVGVIHSTATAIKENKNLTVQSYPNPAQNKLTIVLKQVNNYSFSINNISGATILSGQFNDDNHQINVSKLNTGVYLLRIVSNNSISIKKFIKE